MSNRRRALPQQFDESVRQALEFGFVDPAAGFGPDALGHARRHQLNGCFFERRARGCHLLHDGVAITAFGDHPLDRPDLAFDATQPRRHFRYNLVGDA